MDWSMLNMILHMEYGMSYRQLEERIGSCKGYVSQIVKGKVKSKPAEGKILEALQLTAEQYEAKSSDYERKYGKEKGYRRRLPQSALRTGNTPSAISGSATGKARRLSAPPQSGAARMLSATAPSRGSLDGDSLSLLRRQPPQEGAFWSGVRGKAAYELTAASPGLSA